jgi:syntaxin 16
MGIDVLIDRKGGASLRGAADNILIARDLTQVFVKHRSSRLADSRSQSKKLDDLIGGELIGAASDSANLERRPLRNDGSPAGGEELPPAWIEPALAAREDIKNIRDKMKELAKAQNRRLLRVFGDSKPDQDVELISSQITSLIRRCEQTIHQVKARAEPGDNQECRLNMQRGLATQLQQCSQDFRSSQKEYMAKIKERAAGSSWKDPHQGASNGKNAKPVDNTDFFADWAEEGASEAQRLELEGLETDAQQRTAEIAQIASSISDLHTVFKELAVLVIDQGSVLDRIDYNIERVVDQSRDANAQLQKAERAQKSNRAMKCIVMLVIINTILIVILFVKNRP